MLCVAICLGHLTIHCSCISIVGAPQMGHCRLSWPCVCLLSCTNKHLPMSSGHNSYLQGNQLTSTAGTNTIEQGLRHGCRVVELDVYDGPTEPVSAATPLHVCTSLWHIVMSLCFESCSCMYRHNRAQQGLTKSRCTSKLTKQPGLRWRLRNCLWCCRWSLMAAH